MPLLGEHGLLPVARFVRDVPFRASPSLFYLRADRSRVPRRAPGSASRCRSLALSAACRSARRWRRPAIVWALLWLLYLSFVNVGQTFYGFGWESLLLEAGFFAIFLGAARRRRRASC